MKKIDIKNFLDELFLNARCELNYTNHFELLVAIVLSAQTTDLKVNKVTPVLFSKYPTINDLATSQLEDVVNILNPLGLANNKGKNIIKLANEILKLGEIPHNQEGLEALPGVGRKTANVFLAEGLGINRFAVDTHVSRVAYRLKITDSLDPKVIETDLMKFFEGDNWIKLHHQFIFFGRYFCLARKPECNNCKLKKYCRL